MTSVNKILHQFRPFFAGILLPLGFAPFHLPGLSILSVAFLYAMLKNQSSKKSFKIGFLYGLGFLGVGVSWIYISIHDYGHLNAFFAGLLTLTFILYLALFPAMVSGLYSRYSRSNSLLISSLLFSALWCLGEYLRSTVMTGFPWLLLGFGQIDTPLRFLFPIIGIYGVSFFTCMAATCLVNSTRTSNHKHYSWLIGLVGIMLLPSLLTHTQWTTQNPKPISVGVIQANLSMRDKWDETLFWKLIDEYKIGIEQLVGKKQLIVMPESAIPLPESYVSDLIESIHLQAVQAGSAVLLGIPQSINENEVYFYNTLLALGNAQGHYIKQHLVPFGEVVPDFLDRIIQWLSLPSSAHIKAGRDNQPLVRVQGHSIASLICYELAYPDIIRKQLPEAEWIVSISDDGWFGHSLAIYQQLQMAQVLSLLTGRFQVVSNNDGLSSVIDAQGHIVSSLPAFSKGILEAEILPSTGSTPWVTYGGDVPALLTCLIIVLLGRLRKNSLQSNTSLDDGIETA